MSSAARSESPPEILEEVRLEPGRDLAPEDGMQCRRATRDSSGVRGSMTPSGDSLAGVRLTSGSRDRSSLPPVVAGKSSIVWTWLGTM